MNATRPQKKRFADFDVDFNQVSVEKCFQKYEEIGFIYPAKKALLAPHFAEIKDNWTQMLDSKEDLLWILTNGQQTQDFASISVWKQSNYGLLAQHLVSNGNPFLSLKVMLAAQFKAEHHYGSKEVRSSQNWFRPNNRYAYRVFASMFEKLGPQKASLRRFHYLHQPFETISACTPSDLEVEEVRQIDPELIAFVRDQYGEVFVRAEELGEEDLLLEKLNQTYGQYNLTRSRKIYKIKDRNSQTVKACIIANRAPLGLNFSFLENRAYFILEEGLSNAERDQLLRLMSWTIQPYYADLALGALPIVTDAESSACLEQQDAVLFREYMQSIWLREGFAQWYDHINSFLQKIERRMMARMAA